MSALCRDCLRPAAPTERRCEACRSPRLVSHPELDSLAIAHVDCDAFYAAIEKRDDPSLRDRPLIVGGGQRGVVATCCYIARTYGVRSAMPMFKARALCPDAAIVRPNMGKYAAVGRQVREAMLALTPLVEPISIDEAFLDLTGTTRLHGMSAARALARFASEVETELGITISVGLSYCKFLAKLASDLDKPRGFQVIGRAEALSFLASRPVEAIWGIGRVAAERLRRDGFATIGNLQAGEESTLFRLYGPEGARLWRLARGLDDRPVRPQRETKSVSAETTFNADIADAEDLARILYGLSERVSERLKKQGLAGKTITLKLKTADFRLRTRARGVPEPTQLARRIFDPARDLLKREASGTPFRLIGVGVSDLCTAEEADRGDLVDSAVHRDKAAEAAVDRLREKFGRDAIVRGIAFGRDPGRR